MEGRAGGAMISAPDAAAVDAGARVLAQGGNAIDAAVTAAFVEGVVDPHDSSIGGYVLLTVHDPTGETPGPAVLDAPALAGSRTAPDMWVDRFLRPNPDGWAFFLRGHVNELGYSSICTPGIPLGIETILQRWGTISLAQAVEPAATIATDGFAVDDRIAGYWAEPAGYPEQASILDYVKANAECSRIYLRDGQPPRAGDVVRNPDYGATLRALGERGAGDFYRGDLGDRIARDLAANGSFVTAGDLASYTLPDVEPVVGTYRGHTIVTSPPPHGGPTLVAILNILEGFDLASLGHNSAAYLLLVARAMEAAFADRNRHLGDPAFVDVPLDWLISKERAHDWRPTVAGRDPIGVELVPAGSPGTTQVTVVDGDGRWVSLTHSLGGSSGVVTPGLGFQYNNSMINFHPLPGHANSIAPGKARTTGMAPTIVYRAGQPILALGAPGATRIVTGILQVLLNVIDFGMGIQEAILAPRFDAQGGPIRCQARIPESVCEEVRRSHPIERLPRGHGGIGLVHGVARDPSTGVLSGGADTGASGMALHVPA